MRYRRERKITELLKDSRGGKVALSLKSKVLYSNRVDLRLKRAVGRRVGKEEKGLASEQSLAPVGVWRLPANSVSSVTV